MNIHSKHRNIYQDLNGNSEWSQQPQKSISYFEISSVPAKAFADSMMTEFESHTHIGEALEVDSLVPGRCGNFKSVISEQMD